MKEFDKIIGYSTIKKELEQIADILKNREVYFRLGVVPPRGVLLHGVPGVGKSLMSSALIDASGLKVFVCRKDKPDGDFVKSIKKTFDKAAENAPAIVFLDDMDKFANGDERRPDAEEYVTVQSCIDQTKGKDVFVLATANNLKCLPKSLLRVGRFDRTIYVHTPDANDAEEIITHYLAGKKVADDIDVKTVVGVLNNNSCAMLETVINEAGIYAGFEREECISMEHFLKAAMRVVYSVPAEYLDNRSTNENVNADLVKVAYHEAGHALIHEVFEPGSATFLTVYGKQRDHGGFAVCRHNDNVSTIKRRQIEILTALAGIAAIEQKFGIRDVGTAKDIQRAFDNVEELVTENCIYGFHLHDKWGSSENLKMAQEQVMAAEIEKYYLRVKEIILHNSEFLEALAEGLIKKKMLTGEDIKTIRENSHITEIDKI